jgi:hypothetical protein
MSPVPIEFQKLLEDEKKRLLEQLAIAEAPENTRQAAEKSNQEEKQQDPTPGFSVPQIKEDIAKVDELIKLCQEQVKREQVQAETGPPKLDSQDQAALAVKFEEQTKAQAAAALESQERAGRAEEQQAALRALLNEQNKEGPADKSDQGLGRKAAEVPDTLGDKVARVAGETGHQLENFQDDIEKIEKVNKFAEKAFKILDSLHDKSADMLNVASGIGLAVQSLLLTPPDPHLAQYHQPAPLETPATPDITMAAKTKEQLENEFKQAGENLVTKKDGQEVADDKNSRETAALVQKQKEEAKNLLEGIAKSEANAARRDAAKEPEERTKRAEDREKAYHDMIEAQRMRHENERQHVIEDKFKVL